MAWSYNPESGAAKDVVRLLIGDTDQDDPNNQIFEDEELDQFLAMEDNAVKLASAQALDTMASLEAMIQKKIRILDLTTDGPAVAAELRARAMELRNQFYGGSNDLPQSATLVVDQNTYEEAIARANIGLG